MVLVHPDAAQSVGAQMWPQEIADARQHRPAARQPAAGVRHRRCRGSWASPRSVRAALSRAGDGGTIRVRPTRRPVRMTLGCWRSATASC